MDYKRLILPAVVASFVDLGHGLVFGPRRRAGPG